jgi:hypothetical protein
MPLNTGLQLRDALMSAGLTLPAGATTVISSALDLGTGTFGQFDPQRLEFELVVPALSAIQAAQSALITYSVETSAYTSGASAIGLYTLLQTPTPGTSGASGANIYFKLPQNVCNVGNRFLFCTATGSTSTAASSAVATLYAVA